MRTASARIEDDYSTMSDVTLLIGGRRYKLACAAGEEEHIEMLGREIDGRLQALPGLTRQSEAQTLLYATLLMADELHERAAPAAADPVAELADPLERLAQKLETIAAALEGGPASA